MSAKRIFILTSSGGNGLLQAAIAKEQQLRLENPDVTIFKVDMTKQWLGKLTGRFGIFFWNYCMKKGHVFLLVLLWRFQRLAEILYYPKIFYNIFKMLKKEHVERIIDTQILAPGCMLKAIRLFNWLYAKDIRLEKVITDLPTKDCHDFFNSIKNLSKKDKKYLKVLSISPFLEDCQTNTEFWEKYCNIPESIVHYEPFYIRQSFYKYHDLKRENKPFELAIRAKSIEEKDLIANTIKYGTLNYVSTKEGFSFTIAPQCRVITILLGSQPAQKATLQYAEKILKLVNPNDSVALFVFCSYFVNKGDGLFQKIAKLISVTTNYPSNLTIIPMSYQEEDVIAPLFFRSDLTITRSAGQTSLELIYVGHGTHLIHSEYHVSNKDVSQNDLLKGMPAWEAGSARYLQKEKNSILVTPEIIDPQINAFFTSYKNV